MEKKNKLRFALLLLLILIITVLFLFQQKDRASAIDQSLFKIKNLDKIDRILLESVNEKTELNFIDGRWKLNGAFDADKQMIKVLFATLDQALPKREIGKLKKDSVEKYLSQTGITVSLLEGAETKMKFIAGGNKQKTEAYFQLPGKGIYTMSIPGYRVYVSGIFEARQGVWKDKLIFNFNWRNFRELFMRFPTQPKEDFHVSFKSQYFGIDGMNAPDTAKMNSYLDAVSLLQTREYLSQEKIAPFDSLLKTNPAFVIEIKDIADRTYSLDVFTPEKNSSTVVGRTEKGEVVIFSRNDIAPLAKNKTYFIRKE